MNYQESQKEKKNERMCCLTNQTYIDGGFSSCEDERSYNKLWLNYWKKKNKTKQKENL